MSCFKKLTNSYLHLVKTAENWDDYSWNKNYERMYGGGRRRKNIEKNMQKAFGIESSECKIFPYDLLYFRPHSLSDVQSTEGGGGRHIHSCHTHTKHHIHTTHTYRHINVEFMNTSLGVGYTEEMACGKCGQTPDVATCCSCSCLSAFAWFQFHCLWCLHFDWIFALWLTQFLIRLTSSPPSSSSVLLLAPLTWPMRHQMQPHEWGSKARESKSWPGVKPPYMTDFCQAPYLISLLSLT